MLATDFLSVALPETNLLIAISLPFIALYNARAKVSAGGGGVERSPRAATGDTIPTASQTAAKRLQRLGLLLPTPRTRKRIRAKKISTVVFYGVKILCRKTAQFCVRRCEMDWS